MHGGVVALLFCALITCFLLRDDPEYVERLGQPLPLHAEDTQCLFERTRDDAVAVVRGLFLTALLEGVVATVGYAPMGIPAAIPSGC